MANPTYPSIRVSRCNFGSPAFALALFCALALNAMESAHAQTMNVLYSFPTSGKVGNVPYAGLVMDPEGRLYGTNTSGGDYGNGTVYRLSRAGSGWLAAGLYSFQGDTDGGYPVADVAFGPDGTLYGTTTFGGGMGNYGVVFNLRPPATVCRAVQCPWTETVLYRFTGGSDGGFGLYSPYAFADTLVFDRAGNIYGTTPNGGAHGFGVVFELSRSGDSGTESVLWNFTGGNDGGVPESGVIFDNAGNLYGTASDGGVVYELSPAGSGWTQKTLQRIGCVFGGVTTDAQGNLYGTIGGISCGSSGGAYELSPLGGNWAESSQEMFGPDYVGPVATPTLDAEGNLYGMIPSQGLGGGPSEVFKLTPSGGAWAYTDLYDFTGQSFSFAGVIFDANGNLYGTASGGGQYESGFVWEITP